MVGNVLFLVMVFVLILWFLMDGVVYFLNILCVEVSDFFVSNGSVYIVLVKGGIIYFYFIFNVLSYMILYLYLLENFLYFVYYDFSMENLVILWVFVLYNSVFV